MCRGPCVVLICSIRKGLSWEPGGTVAQGVADDAGLQNGPTQL